ncbi:MAG: hypothetical protein LUE64_04935 [Candidatus Gastranaerophilales bacterium]|nr:hypothetical protein [Candidatus Gastranaerophilales bacterium]
MNKFLHALIVIVFICLILAAAIFIDFKKSYRYTKYKIAIALKSNNEQETLWNFDFEKMAENEVLRADKAIDDRGLPLYIAIKKKFLAQLKKDLPIKYRNDVIALVRKNDLASIPTPVILIAAIIDDSKQLESLGIMQTIDKLSDTQMSNTLCYKTNGRCVTVVYEKNDKYWKIIDAHDNVQKYVSP